MSEVYDEELETRWSRSGARRWRGGRGAAMRRRVRLPRRERSRGGGRGLPVAPLFGPHTDDCPGLELCGTAKNVGAIAAGIVEGLAAGREQGYKNARAVLFTRAVHELVDLLEAAGGAGDGLGLAGMGDLLVTSLGGRNRQYGEVLGTGADPKRAEEAMEAEA